MFEIIHSRIHKGEKVTMNFERKMSFYSHGSIPICLKNHSSYTRMAYDLLRLEAELGPHGFQSPFAVPVSVHSLSEFRAARYTPGARPLSTF